LPAIDEEVLARLMHRATGDLHASPAVATRIAAGARRKTARTRALTASAAGVAAVTATAIGVTASGASSGPATTTSPGHPTTIALSPSARALNHLSLAASVTKLPAAKYVVMAELQGQDKRTTVIDTQSGDAWTYQQGAGIPSTLPVDEGGPTEAQIAAYPTDLNGLRQFLVTQAKQQQAAGMRAMIDQLKKDKIKDRAKLIRMEYQAQPKETTDDLIFSQAAYLLWEPMVGPNLRSALFKVLASTPGVVVNTHARDSIGRAAVEISRYDKAASYTQAIFESPDASRVLETASLHPATRARDGLPAGKAYSLNDTYLSITWTNTFPTKSPYQK
jgi:hypothetical protein